MAKAKTKTAKEQRAASAGTAPAVQAAPAAQATSAAYSAPDAETVWNIVTALKELYPDSLCSLQYEKDYELLFAVRLSAQCTDERVNQVTPALYARFPTLEAFAEADPDEVGQYIHSCGFFRGKSRDIVGSAKMLLEKFGGKVPGTMEELLQLPGVGRKTANLMLGDVYNTPGVVVADTHCIRITGRLGLTDGTEDPGKVETQLRAVLPPQESNNFCHRMVLHGRAVCTARKAKCDQCPLTAWCRYALARSASPDEAAEDSTAQHSPAQPAPVEN